MLEPKTTKTWTWGSIIGFLSVVLPAQLILYITDNIVMAMLIGITTGSISVFSVALYVYNKTKLTK